MNVTNIYTKLVYMLWFVLRHKSEFVLFNGKSDFCNLSVKFQPEINFIGMFTDDKFMAGYNTKTGIPWNSPYFLADFYTHKVKNALFLGGGPCYVPKLVWDKNKKCKIEIVEYDPLTIELAHKYFSLPHDKRITIKIKSAQEFLKKSKKKFDVIFYDLGFSYERRKDDNYSLGNKQLTFKNLKRMLNPNGIIIFVVISKHTKKHKIFINQLTLKMKKHFKKIDLYCDLPKNPEKLQSNIFILSNKSLLDTKKVKGLINSKNYWGEMYRNLWQKKVRLGKL